MKETYIKLSSVKGAKKLHMAGREIYALPSKLRLDTDSPTGIGIPFVIKPDESWETKISGITNYNCNPETGKYLSYYIKES